MPLLQEAAEQVTDNRDGKVAEASLGTGAKLGAGVHFIRCVV